MPQAPGQLRSLLRLHPGWMALLTALLLTLIGITAIDTVSGAAAHKQAWRWLPMAIFLMSACVIPHPRLLGHLSYPLLAFALVLLLYLVIPGAPRVPRVGGARAWLDLGAMRFQPSEMGKVTFVMALAWYLRYRDSYRTLGGLLAPFCLMFVPVILILKEPDLGSAMLFAPTLFLVLLAAGAKLWHLGALLAMGLVGLSIMVGAILYDPPHLRGQEGGNLPGWVHVMASHQERRIAALVWPDEPDYRRREAFQPTAAKNLIGAGGLVGVGKERSSTLIRYNGLPEPHNDMIFAVIVNRWGLLGGGVTIGLYIAFLASVLAVAGRSKDPFARLCCVGFAGLLFAQASVNIGMCMGLLPVIGITLPFISYGGSSLLFTFAMLGLVINFASRRPSLLSRPSFEFDNADAIFQ